MVMIQVLINKDNQLIIRSTSDVLNQFKKKTGFKLYLRSYVEINSEELIIFRADIYYKNLKEIIKRIKKIGSKINEKVLVDSNVTNYLANIDSYINYKYTVGNDIKNDDIRFDDRYEEFQSVVNNQLERKLRSKQMKDAFYLSMMQKAGNFSVPGSGKTSTVYGMYAYLNVKKNVNRIVMIGPLNSFGSWISEYQSCF